MFMHLLWWRVSKSKKLQLALFISTKSVTSVLVYKIVAAIGLNDIKNEVMYGCVCNTIIQGIELGTGNLPHDKLQLLTHTNDLHDQWSKYHT